MLALALPNNKEEVKAQLKEWEQRLNALYDTVESWVKDVDGVECVRGIRPRRRYPVIEHFHVAAGKDPILIVYKDQRRKRIEFKPGNVWYFNATGSVDVFIYDKNEIDDVRTLYDFGGINGKKSKWILDDLDGEPYQRPFNKKAFLGLLEMLEKEE